MHTLTTSYEETNQGRELKQVCRNWISYKKVQNSYDGLHSPRYPVQQPAANQYGSYPASASRCYRLLDNINVSYQASYASLLGLTLLGMRQVKFICWTEAY